MHPSHLATLLLAGVVAFFCGDAQAAPLLSELSPALPLVVQSGFNCSLVNGKLVCGDKKSHAQDGDDTNDDPDSDHHKKKGKGKKGHDDAAELSECTIQQHGGGGGCTGGFKHVCEKLKNGKKCCGCVPDNNAQAPAQAPKVKQFCCSVKASKGGSTSDFCNADRAEAERQANLLKAPGEIPDCYAECFAPDGSSGRKFCH